MPATLSLSLGAPATFGAFTPGVANDYFASTTGKRHLHRGRRDAVRRRPEQHGDRPSGQRRVQLCRSRCRRGRATLRIPGTAYNNVGSAASPLNLLMYPAPVSNDAVTFEFRQRIGANDALRTGTYAKTLTFTLSTTTP